MLSILGFNFSERTRLAFKNKMQKHRQKLKENSTAYQEHLAKEGKRDKERRWLKQKYKQDKDAFKKDRLAG